MEWTIDLNFLIQLIGLDLHQMGYLSQKIVSSPIMTKNLSGVPLNDMCIFLFFVCIKFEVISLLVI
jgi:hypothetical protein